MIVDLRSTTKQQGHIHEIEDPWLRAELYISCSSKTYNFNRYFLKQHGIFALLQHKKKKTISLGYCAVKHTSPVDSRSQSYRGFQTMMYIIISEGLV